MSQKENTGIKPIYQHYIIDMSSNNNFVQVPSVQGDGNGVRGFEIELIANGVPYNIDSNNIVVSIAGTKPDTKHILNRCTITEDGYILVDITYQMSAIAGRGDYQVVLMDTKTNSIIKSFPFYIVTTKSPMDLSSIYSTDEYQLLADAVSKALSDYEYVMDSAQASATNASSSAKLSESWAVGNTGTRSDEDTNNSKYYSECSSSSALSAENSAEQARSDAANIREYATQATESSVNALDFARESEDHAETSKSYAIGDTGIRDGEETDNSKYYYEQSKHIYDNFSSAGNVIGVKGNAESSYRTGSVNLTPANIGLGNVDNTSDRDKVVRSLNINLSESTSDSKKGKSFIIGRSIIHSQSDNSVLTGTIFTCDDNEQTSCSMSYVWRVTQHASMTESPKSAINITNYDGLNTQNLWATITKNEDSEKFVELWYTTDNIDNRRYGNIVHSVYGNLYIPSSSNLYSNGGANKCAIGTPTGTVGYAQKSIEDGAGNVIVDTYAKKRIYGDVSINSGLEEIGSHSICFGLNNKASGECSCALGALSYATNYGSLAIGKHNAAMTNGANILTPSGTVFSIGNGIPTARSNAFSVMYNGVVKAKSTITASTTADYAEFFEWEDGNPNNEDRVGKFVTLNGEKIKIASSNDDYILGIVSGQPFVLGNGDCDTWNGMYLRDEFNRVIYEPAPKPEINEETGEIKTVTDEDGNIIYEGTRPKLNPEYDPDQTYVSRFDRPEWAPVGMLGVLSVKHDGSCQVNGYACCNSEGIATSCNKDTKGALRVIASVSANICKVVLK